MTATMPFNTLSRRRFIQLTAMSLAAMPTLGRVRTQNKLTKVIPGSGEHLSPIGMGTWITFNVGRDSLLKNRRTKVMKTFIRQGGQLIDSSPMYGSSEQTVGYALSESGHPPNLFSATKTWTSDVEEGRKQFSSSQHLWGLKQIDLLQVHNLVAWKQHLPMLNELKQQGLIRYIGVTTSHGRRHEEMETIIKSGLVDFAQLTYNVVDREAEQRLLPAALAHNVGVIANRPFQGGKLFSKIASAPFPEWALSIGCQNWAQFFLRFIVSHPAITCAIPATTRVDHMTENMGSMDEAILPRNKQRKAMLAYLGQL